MSHEINEYYALTPEERLVVDENSYVYFDTERNVFFQNKRRLITECWTSTSGERYVKVSDAVFTPTEVLNLAKLKRL